MPRQLEDNALEVDAPAPAGLAHPLVVAEAPRDREGELGLGQVVPDLLHREQLPEALGPRRERREPRPRGDVDGRLMPTVPRAGDPCDPCPAPVWPGAGETADAEGEAWIS